MALREIRVMGDEVLNKTCKEVTKMTLRTKLLIHDMLDTMYDAGGEGPIVLVNPEIVEESGEQTGEEGCLSVPGKSGIVTRPNHVKVKAFNEDMEPIELEGEELLARAFCHEIDHLDGHLYVELAKDGIHDVEYEED